jgi:rod shape-determining protein MreD
MTSTQGFSKKIDTLWRYITAYAVFALLFFLSVIALPYTPFGHLKIPFFLMGLYYWALHRPRLIPPWLAFAAGLSIDALGMYPLGLNAFLYVAVHALIINQRRYLLAQNFFIIWMGFLATLTGIFSIQWVLLEVIGAYTKTLPPLVWRGMIGTMIYPLVASLLSQVHKILPDPSPSNMFKV